MKYFRFIYLRWSFLFLLLAGIGLCRYFPEAGEGYARFIYPTVSLVLSRLSSVTPWLLEELLVIAVLLLLLIYPFTSRRSGKSWKQILRVEAEALLWVYTWFYWGWGINYFRADFFSRAKATPASYNETRFHQFLATYTDSLNHTFVPSQAIPSPEAASGEIKSLYAGLPAHYGLTKPCSFHNPKRSFFNQLYSRVGVLGYMGPFFAESYINPEMDADVFVYAHELSHWLGVSSEAEANFWAFQVCSRSTSQAIRHSAYMGLFPYVLANASSLLSSSDLQQWIHTIRPEVLTAYQKQRAKRAALYSPLLGKMQDTLYNWYLRSNQIPSGQKNYAEVIGMLLSLPPDYLQEPLRES